MLAEHWRARAATVRAMLLLCGAIGLVRLVPLVLWRKLAGSAQGNMDAAQTQRLARTVERAARRLPIASRCLEHALALGWLLRHAGLSHEIVIAVRPAALRGGSDDLHAWVEVDGEIVLGALPGSWGEVCRLPGNLPDLAKSRGSAA